jgi:mono/diheme cytochrome c family protein
MRLLPILAGMLLLSAHANAQSRRQPDANQGAALSQAWCASCHVVGATKAGRGTDGAPSFVGIARDPAKGPDYVRGILYNPHPPMPPLEIGHDAIEDIVAYFRVLRRGD